MSSRRLTGIQRGVAAFDPTTVANMKVWYKADALALSDTNAVSSWTDSSGHGFHATQGTGSAQPVYRTNQVNGNPVVRFGGATDNDTMQATFSLVTQPNTYFVAAKSTVNQVHDYIDGTPTARVLIGDSTGGNFFGFYAGTAVISTIARDTNWHIHVIIANGASSKMWTDGGAATTGNPGGGGCDGITLGSNQNQNGAFLDGDMFEVLVYTGAVSTANINSIAGYMATRVGTTWATAS